MKKSPTIPSVFLLASIHKLRRGGAVRPLHLLQHVRLHILP